MDVIDVILKLDRFEPVCVCVAVSLHQGFTGKEGVEGPQGPVGMYVSDASVGPTGQGV